MKKTMIFLLALFFIASLVACSTQENKYENRKGISSSSSSSRKRMSIEEVIESSPYIFEATILSNTILDGGDRGAEIRVQIEQEYYCDLQRNDVVTIRSMYPDLFPEGEKRLIFAEPAASVFDESFYYISGIALYEVGETVNKGVLSCFDNMSYEEIIQTVESYAKEHAFEKEINIEGNFCSSDDLMEIYDFSLLAAEVIPQTILIDEVADRTTYICEVTDVIKGECMETMTVTVPKHAMELGASYVLLLTKPGPDSGVYTISAQRSVFPADSEEAEMIRSFQ